MNSQDFFKKKVRCSKCGSWMSPFSITVWGNDSVYKTFQCNRCEHEKHTNNIFRFVFGDSLLEYAEKESLNIVFNEADSKRADSRQIES